MEVSAKEVFGIKFPSTEQIKFEEKFEVIRDFSYNYAESMIAVSKETCHHDENGLTFDYNYAVKAIPWREQETLKIGVIYMLYLVPTFESMCEESQVDACNYGNGWGERTTIADLIDSAKCVVIATEEVDGAREVDNDKLDSIASLLWTIDRQKGLYLGQPKNLLGTTGWEYLDEFVNGVDAISATMQRYESKKAAEANK